MHCKGPAALLAVAALAFTASAQNITGTILIKKKLTKRSVTPSVSVYQRGPTVQLGHDNQTDPLSFERSRVVIWLEGPPPAGVAPASMISSPLPQVAQLDRRFSPDLLVIPAGSIVSFPNMDPIFHNICSLSHAKSFDLGSYDQGQTREISFPKAGIVDVYCHLHPNMEATIIVTPNRWYARADATSGQYRIPDVSPGQYTVVAWHKYAGFFRKTVTLDADHDAVADFFIPLQADARQEPAVTTRFRTRAFLICFIPFAALLAGSFWMVQRFVQSTVREGLRSSLRENQLTIASMHARGDLQNSRFLSVVGENAALKAGIQILLSNPASPAARRTVEDQLRELGEHMGFDFLLVAAPNGTPLAGVIRHTDAGHPSQLVPLDTKSLDHNRSGLLILDGRTLRIASVAIDQDNGNLGSLSVGEYFTFSGLASPAVLLHNGRAIASNIPNIPLDRLSLSFVGWAIRSSATCASRAPTGSPPLCSPGMAAIACAASPTSMPLPLPFRHACAISFSASY